MKFDIYVIQPKLEKFYLDAIKEYDKRLARYGKTPLHLLKNRGQLSTKPTDSSFTVLVTPTKQTISSESFADKINSWGVSGNSQVAFIIGSAQTSHKPMSSSLLARWIGAWSASHTTVRAIVSGLSHHS